MRALVVVLSIGLGACASAPSEPPASAVVHSGAMPAWDLSQLPPRRSRVAVSGIEGTLTAYDVRDAMDRRGDHLDACLTRSRRSIRGEAVYEIHVNRDGSVGRASCGDSNLHDRRLERCVLEVVRDTEFPTPHGGEADVKWTMVLGS